MKDAATEVEIFETEMEIKSSCINGKVIFNFENFNFHRNYIRNIVISQRISEYRSWRQVKIEIKGDILKIYPGRSSKTEANVGCVFFFQNMKLTMSIISGDRT